MMFHVHSLDNAVELDAEHGVQTDLAGDVHGWVQDRFVAARHCTATSAVVEVAAR